MATTEPNTYRVSGTVIQPAGEGRVLMGDIGVSVMAGKPEEAIDAIRAWYRGDMPILGMAATDAAGNTTRSNETVYCRKLHAAAAR